MKKTLLYTILAFVALGSAKASKTNPDIGIKADTCSILVPFQDWTDERFPEYEDSLLKAQYPDGLILLKVRISAILSTMVFWMQEQAQSSAALPAVSQEASRLNNMDITPETALRQIPIDISQCIMAIILKGPSDTSASRVEIRKLDSQSI